MNLKQIKQISLKTLNVNKIESVIKGAFKNTGFNPDRVVWLVGKIIEDNGGFYIDTDNNLYDKTEELPVKEKIEYVKQNPNKYNIFITLASVKPIEYSGIKHDLEDYGLTLEAFKLRDDVTKEELEEYNNIEDEDIKSQDFYEYYTYRGLAEDVYSNTFYADDEGIDFGDAKDELLGLIFHLNEEGNFEIYGCSHESWGMCSGGFRLINNIGSFKDTALKLISDIID